jgi:hypothetical protein
LGDVSIKADYDESSLILFQDKFFATMLTALFATLAASAAAPEIGVHFAPEFRPSPPPPPPSPALQKLEKKCVLEPAKNRSFSLLSPT